MDVVVPSICLSSVTGALLFYAGGILRTRAALAGEGVPTVPPSVELEAARVAQSRAESEAAGAFRAHREAVTALAEERSRTNALREELAGERDARARVDAEAIRERRRLNEDAAGLRAAQGAAETRAHGAEVRAAGLHAELGRAQAELETAVAAARRLAGDGAALRSRSAEQIAGERAAAAEATRAAVAAEAARTAEATRAVETARAEAARLRAENDRLARALAALERERAAAPDLAELQRQRAAASMQLRVLEQRSGEIALREAENADLRRRVETLAATAAEVEALRRRVRDLTAQGFALAAQARPADDDEAPDSWELETSLELGLRELCQREEGCRAAVLSDMRGLLVAAHGEAMHRDELAAAAALTTTTADRLRDLLPLGEPLGFALVDANDVVFRTRWLRWDDECFLLSTLGAAPAAMSTEGAAAEALRDRLAALIGRGVTP